MKVDDSLVLNFSTLPGNNPFIFFNYSSFKLPRKVCSPVCWSFWRSRIAYLNLLLFHQPYHSNHSRNIYHSDYFRIHHFSWINFSVKIFKIIFIKSVYYNIQKMNSRSIFSVSEASIEDSLSPCNTLVHIASMVVLKTTRQRKHLHRTRVLTSQYLFEKLVRADCFLVFYQRHRIQQNLQILLRLEIILQT